MRNESDGKHGGMRRVRECLWRLCSTGGGVDVRSWLA